MSVNVVFACIYDKRSNGVRAERRLRRIRNGGERTGKGAGALPQMRRRTRLLICFRPVETGKAGNGLLPGV